MTASSVPGAMTKQALCHWTWPTAKTPMASQRWRFALKCELRYHGCWMHDLLLYFCFDVADKRTPSLQRTGRRFWQHVFGPRWRLSSSPRQAWTTLHLILLVTPGNIAFKPCMGLKGLQGLLYRQPQPRRERSCKAAEAPERHVKREKSQCFGTGLDFTY